MFFSGLIIGLMIGGSVGFITFALLTAAREADKKMEDNHKLKGRSVVRLVEFSRSGLDMGYAEYERLANMASGINKNKGAEK